jgi:hypothetical protein
MNLSHATILKIIHSDVTEVHSSSNAQLRTTLEPYPA